jgi:hypothetical protein
MNNTINDNRKWGNYMKNGFVKMRCYILVGRKIRQDQIEKKFVKFIRRNDNNWKLLNRIIINILKLNA